MEKEVVTSKKFTLDWKDTGKALLMAVLGAIFALVQTSIQMGDFHFDWAKIGQTALAAGVAYLVKNFFTPAEVKAPAEPKK